VPQFGLLPFAEDQNRLAIPVKPHRPRLRCVLRINCRQPDDLLFTKPVIPVSETGR
jgi:hypothetical protein